ncbi:MAG: helix-turn-helix domain-containing protein [Pseudomonadota bacterium]
MQALESLLKERDFDQISVAEIAATAGVSTGLLYAHFKNKAEFLDALLTEYYARVLERIEVAESSDTTEIYRKIGSLREALRWIAKSTYDQTHSDVHLIRALSFYLRTRPEPVRLKWRALRSRAAMTIESVLDAYPVANRHHEELAKGMLVYFFNSIYAVVLRADDVELETIDAAILTREIGDMAYGYLKLYAENRDIEQG